MKEFISIIVIILIVGTSSFLIEKYLERTSNELVRKLRRFKRKN